MNATHAIPLAHLRTVLYARKVQPAKRWCAYTTHPYTGSDCRHGSSRWKAHGGPLFSPWCGGHIERVADLIKSRGRQEVLRTFGVGIRALKAELDAWRKA